MALLTLEIRWYALVDSLSVPSKWESLKDYILYSGTFIVIKLHWHAPSYEIQERKMTEIIFKTRVFRSGTLLFK